MNYEELEENTVVRE